MDVCKKCAAEYQKKMGNRMGVVQELKDKLWAQEHINSVLKQRLSLSEEGNEAGYILIKKLMAALKKYSIGLEESCCDHCDGHVAREALEEAYKMGFK